MQIKSTKDITTKRIIALIVGESGVGKTSQAGLLPHDKTLIISAESGLLCLSGTNIDVIEVKSEEDLMLAYEFVTNPSKHKNKYKYLYIDSITEIGQMILGELKDNPAYSSPATIRNMYGEFGSRMTGWIKAFRDLGDYSVIFSCLSSQEKDGLVMVDEFNIPGQIVKDNIKAFFDLVLHLKTYEVDKKKVRKFVTDDAESRLAKDRSGKLDAYEDANLMLVINKILGV